MLVIPFQGIMVRDSKVKAKMRIQGRRMKERMNVSFFISLFSF
jgi:hypothetical protein